MNGDQCVDHYSVSSASQKPCDGRNATSSQYILKLFLFFKDCLWLLDEGVLNVVPGRLPTDCHPLADLREAYCW